VCNFLLVVCPRFVGKGAPHDQKKRHLLSAQQSSRLPEHLPICKADGGHTKLESTVRYFGIEVDDALEMAEQTESYDGTPVGGVDRR
jgi:hypothetical protein